MGLELFPWLYSQRLSPLVKMVSFSRKSQLIRIQYLNKILDFFFNFRCFFTSSFKKKKSPLLIVIQGLVWNSCEGRYFSAQGFFLFFVLEEERYSSPDLKLKVNHLASALPLPRRQAQRRGRRLHSPDPQHVTLSPQSTRMGAQVVRLLKSFIRLPLFSASIRYTKRASQMLLSGMALSSSSFF